MKSIKEKAEDLYPDKKVVLTRGNTCLSCGRVKRESFEAGANYVLDIVEKELQRRMLKDYNQNAEEDEIAQGCMASIIMFVRQLKK